MTAFYAPDPINSTQFIPGGNTPAAGGLLFCYQVGSSTKQNTYTDATASTARTNPIILDSGGNIPGNGEVWISSTAKFVLAPSNDTDPPASPYWSRDNLPGVNDPSQVQSEWIPSGLSPTFVSGSSFIFSGDQTGTFTPGRRLKTLNTAGTFYSTIGTSAFSASTTIGIQSDTIGIDSGLSAVSYGILNPKNTSLPLIVSVFNFGAKGDGVTDDTAAITAAIAAVPLGSYLYFPGSFKITSEIALNRSITLWGSGIGSITQASASSKNVVHISASNAGVRDITLTGNGVSGGTTPNLNVVYIDSGDDILIENCIISNGSLTGIQSAGNSSRIKIIRNTFTGVNTDTVQTNSSDIYINSAIQSDHLVEGNFCLSTKKNVGILLQTGNGSSSDYFRRHRVLNNTIITCLKGGTGNGHGISLYLGLAGTNITDCIIENNIVKDCENIGIYVKGILATSDLVLGTIVKGNVLINTVTVGSGGSLSDAAIVIEDAPGSAVIGNIIRQGGVLNAHAIKIVEQSDETVVIGNIIREWTRNAIQLFGSTNPNRCVVSGNIIATGTNQGIRINGSNHVISGNIVKGCSNDGLRSEAGAIDALFANNSIDGSGNGGILIVAGATRTQIFNNVLSNNVTPVSDAGTATERSGNRLSTGAMSGRAVMTNGTVTVNTAEIQTADNVLLTRVVGTSTTRGILTVGTIVAGTSFVIRAEDLVGTLSADDDSTVFWEIVH